MKEFGPLSPHINYASSKDGGGDQKFNPTKLRIVGNLCLSFIMSGLRPKEVVDRLMSNRENDPLRKEKRAAAREIFPFISREHEDDADFLSTVKSLDDDY